MTNPTHTKEQKREYGRLRKAFLAQNPWDAVALLVRGEKVPATHVHHRKGRERHLLDTSTWVATTKEGDNWIHSNESEARRLGLLG